MHTATARSGPASRPTNSEGWATYRDGQVARCPGFNTRTHHLCDTALGVVGPGRRMRVRVRPAAPSTTASRPAPHPATDLLPRCRRCQSELEIAFDRIDGAP